MSYFILFLAVLCIAVQFSVNKVYQKKFAHGMKDIFFFTFAGASANIIFFTLLGLVLYGRLPDFSMFSLIMSIILAIIGTLTAIVGILIMKYGKISVYSVFMMLGGMLLPYFYGVILLNENISAPRIAGLVILICALPCSVINPAGKNAKANNNAPSKIYYILCICIFILNGAASITAKTHAINDMAIPAANLVVYANFWSMIMNGAAYFIFARRAKNTAAVNIAEVKPNKIYAILTAAVCATIGGTGFLFQLIAAKNVPAVALYPFVTGGTIVLSSICARIFFKEKISKPALAGIIMSICGTLLFLID